MHHNLLRLFLFLVSTGHLSAYAVIFVCAFFLGNLFSFSALWIGLHRNLGPHPLIFVILTLFAAHLLSDITWYFCGRKLRGTKLGEWIRTHIPKHDNIEKSIQSNCRQWIFIGEFLAYSSFTMFFLVGWAQISLRRMFPITLAAAAASFSLLLIVTYALFSGFASFKAAAIFKHLEIFFVIGLLLFVLINRVVVKAVKKSSRFDLGSSK